MVAGMRTVLALTSTFPPAANVGSAIRLVKLCKYLPRFGWRVAVLTRSQARDDGAGRELLTQLTGETEVHYAWAPSVHRAYLRARGTAAVIGRLLPGSGAATGGTATVPGRAGLYLELLRWGCVPDEDIVWLPAATRAGIRVAGSARVAALFSSSPMATNHLVARRIRRLTGLPWLAEFRDPWMENPFRRVRPVAALERLEQRLEAGVLAEADAIVCVSDLFAKRLRERRPDGDVAHIPNGFDPEDFADVQAAKEDGARVILHAGNLYTARSPEPFLAALRRLRDMEPAVTDGWRVAFVGIAPPNLAGAVAREGLESVVRIEQPLPHRAIVSRMKGADLLLLIAGPGSGFVPGKLYEYLAAGRPVLALTDSAETTGILAEAGAGLAAPSDDPEAIATALGALMRRSAATLESTGPRLERFSRVAIAARTAEMLDRIAAGRGGPAA